MFPVLFAVTLSQPVFLGMLAAVVGGGAYLMVKGDGRVEARRRNAAKLSHLAAAEGLPLTSGMLDSYAVGDYSGLMGSIAALHEELTDETRRKAAVGVFLGVQLEKNLADPVKRDELLALIEKRLNIKIPRPVVV